MDIQRIDLHTSAFNEITHLYFIKNITSVPFSQDDYNISY